MDYLEICVEVKSVDAETAAAVANMTVPYGIYIEDYSDMEATLPSIGRVDYIDDELLKKDREHAKIHVYIPKDQNPDEAISFIKDRLSSERIEHSILLGEARENEFLNLWKKFYKPERIGERLVICPSWEKYRKKESDVVVSLDPESAFGTGKHETTRLCLELIEKSVSFGDVLLDMGTGSGILGISALALGAKRVVAVDVEKNAVKIAVQNAEKNGFLGKSFVGFCGDAINDRALCDKIGDEYDLITANIVADVIIAMSEMFYNKVRAGGILIASGIIDSRRDEVISALKGAGFTLEELKEDGGWVAAKLTK